jgi:LacI family transcriptional regulator
MMDGKEVAETPVMVAPAGISERRSTDVLSVSNPLAARAIRYIWQHVREDPAVDEVARALGVQRRSLERVFEAQVGMGIKAEMRRRRLELYCRALRASDETIAALSAKMGYRSLETMHRHFREVMGTTPYEYRRASHVS